MPASAASPSPADRRGLALRYRPRTFAQLTGQRHVTAILSRLILRGDIPRQLLLSGTSGLGKTTVGRIVAAAVLCETPMEQRDAADACGTCSACDDITGVLPTHPDVIELDAASNGGKDEIRQIASRAALTPMRGAFKVYIIDEVHAITGPGAQAFLKLLEEPPAHVIFILATTNPERLSSGSGGNGTIRGRCTELELLRPTDEQLVANLGRIAAAEGFELPERVARAVVAATDPELGVRGTVMTLEKAVPALADGHLDDAELAALLGTAPAAGLDELSAAIDAFDRARALAALAALRQSCTDVAVRDGLLAHARTRLSAAVTDGGDARIELAARSLELVATAGPGEAATELLVVRLARPELDPAAAANIPPAAEETLSKLVDEIATARTAIAEVRKAAGQLTQITEHAAQTAARAADEAVERAAASVAARLEQPGATAAPAAPSASPAPAVSAPGPAGQAPPPPPPPDEEPPDDAELAGEDERFSPPPFAPPSRDGPAAAPADGRPQQPAGGGRQPRRGTAGDTKTAESKGSPKRQRLLNRVASLDPEGARMLGACQVKFLSNKTVVVAPDERTAALLGDPHRWAQMAASARKVGAARLVLEDG
jgi:DNA polymerase III subunit gamma/tau